MGKQVAFEEPAPPRSAASSCRSGEHKKTIVIGAGIGGLVAALQMAQQGDQVTVLERSGDAGGKLRQLHGVDSGPTVFTMRWILDEIFQSCGERLEDHITIVPLHNLARHSWEQGAYGLENESFLDLYADRAASVDAIGRFSGAAQARQFNTFCDEAQRVYRTLESPYIRSQKPNFIGLTRALGVQGLQTLAGLGPFASLWKTLGRHFTDPRLRQLFGRYATYCGASPWQAPATLMLIAQVEMDGVWAVDGGMRSIVLALQKLAEARGVKFRFNTHVSNVLVTNSKASGVEFFDGDSNEKLEAHAVIFNGDIGALAEGSLGENARNAITVLPALRRVAQRSLSALTLSFKTSAPAGEFPLVRHNVFFTAGYEREFQDVFSHHRLPRAGTVYVCAQDRCDDAKAQRDNERILLLINAPAVADQPIVINPFSDKEVERCIQEHLQRLEHSGLTLPIDFNQYTVTTPIQFNQLYPGTGGALYGQASHGWMNQFQRMGAVSRLPGLYLAGGSVHPGPGVPMAAMSGQLAAEAILASRVSMSR